MLDTKRNVPTVTWRITESRKWFLYIVVNHELVVTPFCILTCNAVVKKLPVTSNTTESLSPTGHWNLIQGHWNLIQSTDRWICAQVVHGWGAYLWGMKVTIGVMRNDSKTSESSLPFCWKWLKFLVGWHEVCNGVLKVGHVVPTSSKALCIKCQILAWLTVSWTLENGMQCREPNCVHIVK